MSENLFNKATRKKLRFDTPQGTVSTEDLWDLSLTALNKVAISLHKEIKEFEEEDFLRETPATVTTTQLEFDTVLHILNTKKEEKENRLKASENKEAKDKLVAALARKQEESLSNMSEEDLLKSIANLTA